MFRGFLQTMKIFLHQKFPYLRCIPSIKIQQAMQVLISNTLSLRICVSLSALCLFLLLVPRSQSFRESDAFVGFQRDTPASIVLHASEMVKHVSPSEDHNSDKEMVCQ